MNDKNYEIAGLKDSLAKKEAEFDAQIRIDTVIIEKLKAENEKYKKADKFRSSMVEENIRLKSEQKLWEAENAELRKSEDFVTKENTKLYTEIKELKARWEEIRKEINKLLGEHCPEDDIKGIRCSTCDYLNKVKKKMQELEK